MTIYIYMNFIINMKALVNIVILQCMLQLNFLKMDKSNIYGVEFYYSGLHLPRIDVSTCSRYDLIPTNNFDQVNDYLTMIDNLLDQFDMIINNPNKIVD